jgi:hypothetical protein
MPARIIQDPDEATEILPCCNDATEIEGLPVLKRSFPRSWDVILNRTLIPEVEHGINLRGYLSNGAGGLLGAAGPRDQSIEKKRACARRVAMSLGHLVVAELGEADLHRAREAYRAENLGKRSTELVQVDIRVFRQAVHNGQVALGLDPVARTWGHPQRGKNGKSKKRAQTQLQQVRCLLQVASNLVAAAIALIVGCNLLPSELLALRVGDICIPETHVRVLHLGVRGRGGAFGARYVRIPSWAWQLVRRAWPRLARMESTDLLFASPRDATRPWQGLNRALRRAAVQAGLQAKGAKDPRFTPMGLRRLHQIIARQAGLPRALVRGSAVCTDSHPSWLIDGYQWLERSDQLALKWTYLTSPPRLLQASHHHLPRRAPRGVRADQPEYPSRRSPHWQKLQAKKRKLPWGCDEVPEPVPHRSKRPFRTRNPESGDVYQRAPSPAELQLEREAQRARLAEEAARVEEARADGLCAGLAYGATAGAFVGMNLSKLDGGSGKGPGG